jgi:hypothetical protein
MKINYSCLKYKKDIRDYGKKRKKPDKKKAFILLIIINTYQQFIEGFT